MNYLKYYLLLLMIAVLNGNLRANIDTTYLHHDFLVFEISNKSDSSVCKIKIPIDSTNRNIFLETKNKFLIIDNDTNRYSVDIVHSGYLDCDNYKAKKNKKSKTDTCLINRYLKCGLGSKINEYDSAVYTLYLNRKEQIVIQNMQHKEAYVISMLVYLPGSSNFLVLTFYGNINSAEHIFEKLQYISNNRKYYFDISSANN